MGFILFTLVLARVAGLMSTAPVFGAVEVPWRIRIILAVGLAALIAPMQWQATVEPPQNLVHYGLLLGCEALIGVCLGLGIMVFFHGITLAGELIGQVGGLSLAEVFDANLGEKVSPFSQLLLSVALAVFLCVGGHRLAMAALLDTFQAIPPGSGKVPPSLGEGVVSLVSQSFSLAVRVAAPTVTALLLAALILGFVSRTLPQINVLSVGVGLNALLAFGVMALTVGTAVWAFEAQIEPALETILNALQTPIRTQWLS